MHVHADMGEQGGKEGVEHAPFWGGAPELRVSKVEMLFPTFTTWGAARQNVQDPIAQGGVETQGLQLNDELGGYHGVECWALDNEQHSYISIPLSQMG